jgi:hypothetical protein
MNEKPYVMGGGQIWQAGEEGDSSVRAAGQLINELSRPTFVWRMWSGLARKGGDTARRNAAVEVEIAVLRYIERTGREVEEN